MLFNSLEFALFFLLVAPLTLVLRGTPRRLFLLSASFVFYMAFVPAFALILVTVIVIDYLAGLWMDCLPVEKRRPVFRLSLLANLGILAVFKYANFLINNINSLLRLDSSIRLIAWTLPIGLSFHTFQALSYTFEVSKGRTTVERSLITYALYVMFFPQLVAGPIERPQNILPQLRLNPTWDPDRICAGLSLMSWGFFKKIVIADRAAAFVNPTYNNLPANYGLRFIVATICFAFQIYCDFSGYSDIARGAGRVLGVELMHNFRRPYLSRSVDEFWTRWHVSLSSWFRDYVYIPLGGGRSGARKTMRNVLLVFLLSGLWHGAGWNFVLWGLLNGLFVLGSRRSAEKKAPGPASRSREVLANVRTFLLICLTWVFFRAPDATGAIKAVVVSPYHAGRTLFRIRSEGIAWWNYYILMDQSIYEFGVLVAALVFLLWFEASGRDERLALGVLRFRTNIRYLGGLSFATLSVGMFGVESTFLYFQF